MPTAIVTGTSQGLGLELARALCRDGWTVVGDARHAGELEAALAGIPTARPVPGDVAEPEHRARLVATAGERLDLLVHNASSLGPTPLPPLAALAAPALREVLEVNLVAPLALTQSALPLLAKSPAPTVIAISSDAAVEAYPGWGGYGLSKAALDHLVAVLAAEQVDLSCYAVDPGDMRTAMHQAAFPGEDISDRPEPASVVPLLLELIRRRPASGRYRLADLGVPA